MKLDDNQMKAVRFGYGPAITVAGPGSGKTAVLTERIRFLCEELTIPPDKILVITFTRAAALQMETRFNELSNEFLPVTFVTFHSLFYAIIKDFRNGNVSLITPKEKQNILRTVLADLNLQIGSFDLCGILSDISEKKLRGEDSDYIPLHTEITMFDKIYSKYIYETKEIGKPDFDDFAAWVYDIFKSDRQFLLKWRKRYDFCLVDEFQDINEIQYKILKLLNFDSNIFAVGDEDQSIYGFRGCSPKLLFRFENEFKASRFDLSLNYRCASKIVDKSVNLISFNTERYCKNIKARPDAQDGEFIVRKFMCPDQQYDDLAEEFLKNKSKKAVILLRTNLVNPALISVLRKKNINIHMKEKPVSISSNPIVKDICAYFELSTGNLKYDSLIRIINKPSRYVSREFIYSCKTEDDTFGLNGKFRFATLYKNARGKAEMGGRIYKLEHGIKEMSRMDSFEGLMYLFFNLGYDTYLKSNGIKYENVFEILKQTAREFNNMEDFLLYIDLSDAVLREDITDGLRESEGEVEIATMHAAKGLEWEEVYIPDVNDGNVPHKKAISKEASEEERRLFYVAMTRASRKLWIGCVSNEELKMHPSRFVKELN